MTTLRRNAWCLMAAALVLGSALTGEARAADPLASGWVEGLNNKARLLAGSAVRDGKSGLYAGVEIDMPEGWKTYWRLPGDAGGVPPEFDWTGSENLNSAQVLYPAPHRLHDKAGDVVGYKDHVLFPILLSAKDTAKPIELHAKVAYGVCKDICIPAESELVITVPPSAPRSDTLTEILARVPRATDRTASDPKLAQWRIDATGGKPLLNLSVETASPADTDVFVEAPGGIYVPLPKRTGDAGGTVTFAVDLTDGVDIKDLKGKPLTVTMIDGKGASEATITLE